MNLKFLNMLGYHGIALLYKHLIEKIKFYKVHYNLSNFHKILSTQNAMDTPNETEETTTAINGK